MFVKTFIQKTTFYLFFALLYFSLETVVHIQSNENNINRNLFIINHFYVWPFPSTCASINTRRELYLLLLNCEYAHFGTRLKIT